MESATLIRPRPVPAWLARLLALPPAAWARTGFAALAAGAFAGYAIYPTYPVYDSYYYLLWGRELVHFQHLSFKAYQAPTEHPLAIAFGALASLVGQHADRVLVAATIAAFLVLVAGLYRLARLAFTPFVGAVAVVVLISRLNFDFYVARAYVDIPYMAIVVWAAALEVERPRRGIPVLLLLVAASLLRPEAWVLAGLYVLWCGWRAGWPARVRFALLAASGPLLWLGLDAAVTGDPLFSLHSTSGLATAFGRTKGVGAVPGSMWHFLSQLVKAPVIAGAGAGFVLALWLVPRRTWMPLALALSGLVTFVAVGVAGLSVIQRYLLVPALMLMLFCAVALGGWTMLEPGRWLRRAWALTALALAAYAVSFALSTVSINTVKTELGFRGDSHSALATILADPHVRAGLRCGPLSVPNHKLIPEARWILGRNQSGVIARSEARSRAGAGDVGPLRRIQHGVALYPTGLAVSRQALVDTTDDPLDQVPLAGFERVATTQYYGAYARC